MKKIVLKVTIEVPDDYIVGEPEWTLEEAVKGEYEYFTSILKDE